MKWHFFHTRPPVKALCLTAWLLISGLFISTLYSQNPNSVSYHGDNVSGLPIFGGDNASIFDILSSPLITGHETFVARWKNVAGTIHESNVEFVEYNTPQFFAATTNIGNSSRADTWMLFVRFNADVTVLPGVTVSSAGRKRGMYWYVKGNLVNHGTISMTARGATSGGQNVLLFHEEFVPAAGGARGNGRSTASWVGQNGYAGGAGTNRRTGGGGGGGLYNCTETAKGTATSGNGSAGTSYSGGSGGGGIDIHTTGSHSASHATANGGAGGAAFSRRNNTGWTARYAGGGAGNSGGVGKNTTSGQLTGGNDTSRSGQSGTGGLLVIYANAVTNRGSIVSRGSNGGPGRASGGSSGGGSINIFQISKQHPGGSFQVNGGVSPSTSGTGGAGGAGTTTITPAGLILNSSHRGAGVINGGGFVKYGETLTVSTTVNEGYQFLNWTDSQGTIVSTEPTFQYTVPIPTAVSELLIELTANFLTADYSLEINKSHAHAADVTILNIQQQYFPNEPAHITTVLKDGYSFVHFTDGVSTFPSKNNQPPVSSGMVLWLDASDENSLQIEADKVALWMDKSGQGHHASQANVANRPTLEPSAQRDNNVIHFTGTSFLGAGNIWQGADQATIFTVFSHDHTGTVQPAGPIWQTANESASGFFPRWTNGLQYVGIGSGTMIMPTIFNRNQWYNTAIVHASENTYFYSDAQLFQEAFDSPPALSDFVIGLRQTGGPHYFRGRIAEIIVYNRALTDFERMQVEQYLNAKWMDAFTFVYPLNHLAADQNNTVSLNAKFEAIDYSIGLEKSHPLGGDFEKTSTQDTYRAGETAILRTSLNPGYTFHSFTDGLTTWTLASSNVEADEEGGVVLSYTVKHAAADENYLINIRVNYTTSPHNITLNKSPNIGGPLVGAGSYFPGEPVFIQAPAVSGYNFMGWFNQADERVTMARAFDTIMPPNHLTLTAKYIVRPKMTYQMLMYHSPGGIPYAGGTIDAGTFDVGEAVPISAGSVFGYGFWSWTTVDPLTGTDHGGAFANAYSGSTTYTMPPNDVVLTARFMIDAAMGSLLTIHAGPDPSWGSVFGEGHYFREQEVFVEATPAPGYRFAYWYTLSSGYIADEYSPQTIYFMPENGDAVLVAMFEPDPGQYANVRVISLTDNCTDCTPGQIINLTREDPVAHHGTHTQSGLPIFGGEQASMHDILASPLITGHQRFVARWKNPAGGHQESYAELLEYHQDVVFTATTNLGRGNADNHMLLVRFAGNVEIRPGVTIRPDTRKKGMFWLIGGELINHGTISMTARGAAGVAGQNLTLWNHPEGGVEFIPAAGGAGGARRSSGSTNQDATRSLHGNAGASGNDRRTGGGGSGGLVHYLVRGTAYSGQGTAGTSYSGGTGGGGIDMNTSGARYASAGTANGGRGGDAYSRREATNWAVRYAGGGAGNGAGSGKYTTTGQTTGGNHSSYNGTAGTGGLFVLYAHQISNQGSILAQGSAGGPGRASGGSSGGGSINLFYGNRQAPAGTISAAGGISPSASGRGGAGGNGSVSFAGYGYNAQDTIRLMAKPHQGYVLSHWVLEPALQHQVHTDHQGNSILEFLMPVEPVTATAIFEQHSGYYSLNVTAYSGVDPGVFPAPVYGTVTDNIAKPAYQQGEMLSITATAASGYRFHSFTSNVPVNGKTLWQTDPNNPAASDPELSGGGIELNEPVTLQIPMPANNLSIMAYFTSPFGLYMLQLRPQPSNVYGTTQDLTNAGPYIPGAQVSIRAMENPGFIFTGWQTVSGGSIADPQALQTTFTMPANQATLNANFQVDPLQSFTLTAHVNSTGACQVSGAGVFNALQQIQLSALPSQGYRFVRWSGRTDRITAGTTSNAQITVTMPGEDIELSAEFALIDYQLTVRTSHSQRGYTLPAMPTSGSLPRNMDAVVNIQAHPYTGYRFKEWTSNTGAGLANPEQSATTFTMPASNATLTGNFEPDPGQRFPLSMLANPPQGGTANDLSAAAPYMAEDQISIQAVPNPGYTFSGWTRQGGGTIASAGSPSTTFTMPAAEASLTAAFTPINYTISLSALPATTYGSVSGATGTIHVNQQRQLSATPLPGHRFVQWQGDAQYLDNPLSPQAILTMPPANVSLQALFEVDPNQSFPLNLVASPPGAVAQFTGQGNYNVRERIAIQATPTPGYQFTGWQSSLTQLPENTQALSTHYTMTAQGVTLTAAFRPIDYSIQIQILPDTMAGTTSGQGNQYHVTHNVPLVATPKSGYLFVQWEGDTHHLREGSHPSQGEQVVVMPPGNVNLRAVFAVDYSQFFSLLLAANPPHAGNAALGKTEGSFNAGTRVELHAEPQPGYMFSYWSCDAGGRFDDPYSSTTYYTMVGDNTLITANFELERYALSITSTPPEWGTAQDLSRASPYLMGEQVSLQATPAYGYRFLRWTDADAGGEFADHQSPNTQYTMPARPANILAEFEPDYSMCFTISIAINHGSRGHIQGDGCHHASQQVSLRAVPEPGYAFHAWVNEQGIQFSTSPELSFLMPTNDINWQARFIPDGTLVFPMLMHSMPLGAGILHGQGEYMPDEVVLLRAEPNEGYVFLRWESNPQGEFENDHEAETSFRMPGDIPPESTVDVTAVFELRGYSLTLTALQPHWGSVAGAGVYTMEQEVSISATPFTGYKFSIWSGTGLMNLANPLSAATTITMGASNATATAWFDIDPMQLFSLTTQVSHPDRGQAVNITEHSPGTPNTGPYNVETTVTVQAIPEPGYAFTHWSNSPAIPGMSLGGHTNSQTGVNTLSISMPAEDITLTAHFQYVYYPLTLTPVTAQMGGVTNLTLGSGPYHVGQSITVRATPLTGYRLQQWSTSSNINGQPLSGSTNPTTRANTLNFTMPANPVELHAIFEEDPNQLFPLTVAALPEEFGDATNSTRNQANQPDPGPYMLGTGIEVSAVANPGYYFEKFVSSVFVNGKNEWSWADEEVMPTPAPGVRLNLNMPAYAVDITALFQAHPYTLTHQVAPLPHMGNIIDTSMGEPLYVGDPVAMLAQPQTGYRFKHWITTSNMNGQSLAGFTYSDSGENQLDFVMPANDVLMFAFFEVDPAQLFHVHTGVNPEQTGTLINTTPAQGGGTDPGPYTIETNVTLMATPEPGYRFDRFTADNPIDGRSLWRIGDTEVSGDAHSGVSLNFVMPAYDVSITAHFVPIPYALTTEVRPMAAYGTIARNSGNGPYFINDPVSLSATPNPGYRFVEWTCPEGLEEQSLEGDTDPETGTNTLEFVMPAQDIHLVAHFEKDPDQMFSVTTLLNPENSAEINNITLDEHETPDPGPYFVATPIRLSAQAQPGYRFSRFTSNIPIDGRTEWTIAHAWVAGDIHGTVFFSFPMPGENVEITAHYLANNYSLTLSGSPTTWGTLSDATNTPPYQVNSPITVHAAPTLGYRLVKIVSDVALMDKPPGYEWTMQDDALTQVEGGAVDFAITMPPSNLGLTAYFEVDPAVSFTLTLSASPSGWGGATNEHGQSAFPAGTTVPVTAEPQQGYRFTHWSGNTAHITQGSISSENITITMPAENIALTAHFDVDTETRFDVVMQNRFWYEEELVAVTEITNVRHPAQERIQISAHAQYGYTFKHWTTDQGGHFDDPGQMQTHFTTPGNNVVIAAHFEVNTAIRHKLLVEVQPDASLGSAKTIDDGNMYHARALVGVAATPATGARFLYWTSEGGGSFADEQQPSTNFTMPVFPMPETKVIAHFQWENYTLSLSQWFEGSAALEAEPQKDFYIYNEPVVITARMNPGFAFAGFTDGNQIWTEEHVGVLPDNTYRLELLMPNHDLNIELMTIRELQIAGSFTANSKVYDQTPDATMLLNELSLLNLADGDQVLLESIVLSFEDAQAANDKTVHITGASIAGADSDKYRLSLVGAPTTLADITKRELTLQGLKANNKTYDALTTATLDTLTAVLIGVLTPDEVFPLFANAQANFLQAGAGTAIPVTVSGIVPGGAQAENYKITMPEDLQADILRASLLVIADNQQKIYDAAVFSPFTITYQGFAQGEDKSVLSGEISIGQSVTEAKNTGTYTISISNSNLASPNYDISYQNGTLTIDPRPLTIIAQDQQMPYSGETFPLQNYTVTYENFATGEGPGVLSGSHGFEGPAIEAVNTGSYAIEPVQGSLWAGNYVFVFQEGSLQITPLELHVYALPNQSKHFGAGDPVLEYTHVPTELIASNAFSGNLQRAPGETPGKYSIIQGTLSAGENYAISFYEDYFSILGRLRFQSDPPTSGTLPPGTWLLPGDLIEISVAAAPGYEFDYWSLEGFTIGHQARMFFTMPVAGDVLLTAHMSSSHHIIYFVRDGTWNTPGNWARDRQGTQALVSLPQGSARMFVAARATAANDIIIDEGSSLTILPEGKLNAGKNLIIRNTNKAEPALIVAPAGALTVQGALINESGQPLIIESNDQGTGSLLHHNANVSARVQQHIAGDPGLWRMMAAPVADHALTTEFVKGPLYAWFEPAQSWVSSQNQHVWPTWEFIHHSDNFQRVRGYLIAPDFAQGDNPTLEFSGLLNQGSFDVTLQRKGNQQDPYYGFNLIGNPYPSAIDWKAPAWDRSELVQSDGGTSFWVWDATAGSGNYGTYHSQAIGDQGTLGVSRHIAPMQAFWVRAAHDGARIRFNDNVRTHAPQAWLKTASPAGVLRITVKAHTNGYKDETIIEFGHGSDMGGTEKMFSIYPQAPGLYTLKEQQPYSINFLTNIEDHPTLPLALQAGSDGAFTLSVSGAEGFGGMVLLEDLHTGNRVNLKEQAIYRFSAKADDDPQRFLLRFAPEQTTGIIETKSEAPIVWYASDWLHIVNTWDKQASVQVFDAHARLILKTELGPAETQSHAFRTEPGVYLVRLQSADKIHTVKLIVGRR